MNIRILAISAWYVPALKSLRSFRPVPFRSVLVSTTCLSFVRACVCVIVTTDSVSIIYISMPWPHPAPRRTVRI